MMNNFDKYFNNLDQYKKDYFNMLYPSIPIEVKEYIDVIIRLKDIDYFCGMKYASPYLYNFAYDFSRLDHSLACFLETLNFTNDFAMSLSALFHDCNTPIFSHVVDYLYGDYVLQEVSESKNELFLLNNKLLAKLLDKDSICIEQIICPKQYSLVDNERPKLCVDRLDGIFLTSLAWSKCLDFKTMENLYKDLVVFNNEDKEKELGFNDKSNAEFLNYLELKINKLCHGKEDNYSMFLMSSIIDHCIFNKYIDEMELYTLTEKEFIDTLKTKIIDDYELFVMWEAFTKTKEVDGVSKIKTKVRYLNPLYNADGFIKRIK